MEENTVKNYLYDYQKNSFKIKKDNDDTIYYLNVDHNYIEVNEEIFKVFKASYDKLRYTYKQEVANSVSHYEDIDLATSFFIKKNVGALDNLLLKDITYLILDEIDQLKNKDREIAKYYFIYEYKINEISKKLNMPRKTVEYRKIKFKNICKKSQKIFTTLMTSFHVFK